METDDGVWALRLGGGGVGRVFGGGNLAFWWVFGSVAVAFGGFPVAFGWSIFVCFQGDRWLCESRRFLGGDWGLWRGRDLRGEVHTRISMRDWL